MKINKLIGIAVSVGVVLGCCVGFMNLESHQAQLAKIENNPEVYDFGSVGICKLTYIRSSHQDLNGIPDNVYQEDVYFKSDCNGNIAINKVKENINFSRMTLLNEKIDTQSIKKINKIM